MIGTRKIYHWYMDPMLHTCKANIVTETLDLLSDFPALLGAIFSSSMLNQEVVHTQLLNTPISQKPLNEKKTSKHYHLTS